MSLFHRDRGRGRGPEETLWLECPFCKEINYRPEVERLLWVCPKCSYHYRISVYQRIKWTVDKEGFQELFAGLSSLDPLRFRDERRYADRLQEAKREIPHGEAMVCGEASLVGRRVILGVQDFSFMGGSMGSVVGEKVARMAEMSVQTRTPLVMFCASGGARMQEGLLSLMQMAKTTVAISRLKEAGVPYISVLTDPTTGGVAASFAMQGDVVLAEPKAMIGFAGPRVIEKTMGQKLPPGFQRAEYMLEHGLVDAIVPRERMRETLSRILSFLCDPPVDRPRKVP